jgi:hypothetical protein
VTEIPKSGAAGGANAASCYRVAAFSGSLEVTARLKNSDDLELLLTVLKVHEHLFTKTADQSATKVSTKVDRRAKKFFTEADQLVAPPFPKPDPAKIENLAKAIEKVCPAETKA